MSTTIVVPGGAISMGGGTPRAGRSVSIPGGAISIAGGTPVLKRKLAVPGARIFIAGYAPRLKFTTPTPAGNGIRVYLNGVERSASNTGRGIRVNPGIAINRQINSRGTATFTAIDPSRAYLPSQGDTVQIYSGSTLLFNGFINTAATNSKPGVDINETLCQCVDLGVQCDRRVVYAAYTGPFWATASLGQIVQDIVWNYLQGTGINLVTTPILAEPIGLISFYALTVTEAFNQLASQANCDWRIDEQGNLRFFTPTSGYVSAPFDFTDSSLNWITLTITEPLTLYANRVYVKSSSNLGNNQTDTATVGGPFPWVGTGGGFGSVMTKYPLTSAPNVTVNGTPALVVSIDQATP